MANLRDPLSDCVDDMNEPTIVTQTTTSLPFRVKNSSNNKIKEVNRPNSGKAPIIHLPSTSKEEPVISSDVGINSITTECQNLNNKRENVPVHNGENPIHPKGKNLKKKEKLNHLKIPSPSMYETPKNKLEFRDHNSITSMQDFFVNQISPLYVSTSSRYLENLTHHPQYQHIMNMHQLRGMFQCMQPPVSVPNTPLQEAQSSLSPGVNNHNASTSLSEPNSPRFIQNIMQHPLLSQSFKVQSNVNFQQIKSAKFKSNNTCHVSPKGKYDNSKNSKNKNKNDENNPEFKFESYLSQEEVEVGLKNNTLIEGVLRINPKQFQHAYISSSDRAEQDIHINGVKNRNRALEGDIVILQYIIDESEDNSEDKQKQAKVVFIKEKVHTRTCIGTLKLMADKNRQKALFIPRDHRIPRLNIPFISWPDNFYEEAKNYENTLFLAKIFDWYDVRYALGKILCNIGQSGDMKAETRAILAQTGLDVTPYGPDIRDLFPRLDYTIPEDEIKSREDCRKLCLFSIDPSNCRDIDDAVSVKELENGNYEIGVHISDVAHFLNENTILDKKVALKATTIYLVEQAFHMLPDELCMLCSLFPGMDKLAFSVFWEITKDAKVLSHRFSKTVIHSCCQLAYDHAQGILNDKENTKLNFPEIYSGFAFEDICKSLKILNHIAIQIRRRRFEGGALSINQPKVSFHLSPSNGLPESFWIYESQESHQLIEEFMLLANMTVANRIYNDHPKLAFLRSHPPPSGFMLQQLAKALKPMGINLDISSAGDLHKSLLQYVGPDNTDKGKALVLSMLCAKPMARAKYFCAHGCDDEDFHHYALNVPLYTHFTSPIRRYADIMVHRLLAASLNYREVPDWDVDEVRLVAAQCNKQKYNAKKAGELSTELYILKYIEMKSPFVTEAVVVEVREKHIDVIVVAMGLNRRIYFNNEFPGDYKCITHEAGIKLSKMELTWHPTQDLQATKQVIEVFSTILVELHKGDDIVKVETRLVRPQVLNV